MLFRVKLEPEWFNNADSSRIQSTCIDTLAFKGGRERFHTRFHTFPHLRLWVENNGGRGCIQVMRDGVLLHDSLTI